MIVRYRASLLRQASTAHELPDGLTLAEIVARVEPDPAVHPHVAVMLDGEFVDGEWWPRVRPKGNRSLVLLGVPAGGADTLRMVLLTAVVVAAVVTTVASGGTLGPMWAGVLGAGISIGGTLAVNALIPPSQPKLSNDFKRESPTYSLESVANRLRAWEPVPVLLGKMRVYPPLAAVPVSLQEGDKNYFTSALCWTQGKALIEEFKIGETPVTEYRGIESEWLMAGQDDPPYFELYSNDITQDQVGSRLAKADGYVTRTTRPGTTRLGIGLYFPRGLFGVGETTGDEFGQSVSFEFQRAPAGSGAWVALDSPTITRKTRSAVRVDLYYAVPEGQHDVRVRRLTSDLASDETYKQNESQWLLLTSIRPVRPVLQTFVTASCHKALATNQLSGNIETYNGVATTICLDYDAGSGEWVERATDNPASLYRHVLQFPTQPDPLLDEEIHLADLADWHQYCTEQGFTCSLYVDWTATLDEILELVAQAGRGRPDWRDGLRTVTWDRPQTVPVHGFTGRNVRNFNYEHIPLADVHGFRVRFKNEQKGYASDEVIAYFDGYSEDNASRFEELDAPWIRTADLAWRHGRWMYAQAKLRPAKITFEAGWDHLIPARGDLVEIQHDVVLIGAGQGRIKSLRTDAGGQVVGFRLDDRIPMTAGITYAGIVHGEDATRRQFALVSNPGASPDLELVTPTTAPLLVGETVMVGAMGRETMRAILRDVEPMEELGARLTLVPAAWVDETEPIPEFDSVITPPAGALVPIILTVRSDVTVAQRDADGSVHLQLVVTLFSSGIRWQTQVADVQLCWGEETADPQWRYMSFPAEATEVILPSIEVGRAYLVGARYRFRDGSFGEWSGDTRHVVANVTLQPPNVSTVFVDGENVAWSYPGRPPDHKGFLVKVLSAVGADASGARALTDGLVFDSFIPISSLPQDTREVLVWAVNTAGQVSDQPGRCEVTPSELTQRVVWHREDFKAGRFAGAITGGQVDPATGDLVASDTSRWLVPSGSRWLTPEADPWLAGSWGDVTYQFSLPVPPTAKPSDRVFIELTTEGAWTLERRWAGDLIERARLDEPLPDWLLTGDDRLPIGVRYKGKESSGVTVFGPGTFQTGVFVVGTGTLAEGLESDVFFQDVFEPEVFDEDPEVSGRPWLPWTQGLRPVAGETLTIRLRSDSAGSTVRPRVTALRVVIDAAEVEEIIGPVDIPAQGLRPTPARQFRGYRYVHHQKVATTEVPNYELLLDSDLPSAVSPLVRAVRPDGTPTTGRVVLFLGGW